MKIKPIAIFPHRLLNVPSHCGGRVRGRKKNGTQIACRVDQRGEASFAIPLFLPGEHVGPPTFRLQLRVIRHAFTDPRRVGVVLQPALESKTADPEQRILLPLFVDESCVIFEFTRGDVLTVASDGRHSLRFAAIDPRFGRIGTRDDEVTDVYSKLIERCRAELAGGPHLFLPKGTGLRPSIPNGPPELAFGEQPAAADAIEPPLEELGLLEEPVLPSQL